MPQNIYINNDENKGIDPLGIGVAGAFIGLVIGAVGGFKCAQNVYGTEAPQLSTTSRAGSNSIRTIEGTIKDAPFVNYSRSLVEFHVEIDPAVDADYMPRKKYLFRCIDHSNRIRLSALENLVKKDTRISIEMKGPADKNRDILEIDPIQIVRIGDKRIGLEDLAKR